jgi:hypothetical protein
MKGELKNKIGTTIKDQANAEILLESVDLAAEEFPCLTCPSHDDCGTFKWYLKWFGEELIKR